MLESGADVNAQDKGGLIPLHNASSYGVSLAILQRMREAKIKRIRVQMHKRLLRKYYSHNHTLVSQLKFT